MSRGNNSELLFLSKHFQKECYEFALITPAHNIEMGFYLMIRGIDEAYYDVAGDWR